MASNVYKKFSGCVVEIINRYKAVVEFHDQGSKHRALLKVEKLTCKPTINKDGSEEHHISDFVVVGTPVKCLCHKFDETGEHKCGWYVADVQSIGEDVTNPLITPGLCPNMTNKVGLITYLDQRVGLISLDEDDGNPLDVLFIANTYSEPGKRVKSKQPIDKGLALKDKVHFDAVPIDPEENVFHCSWFAPLVWKRTKPPIDNDPSVEESDSNLALIKNVIRNPKSQFIRGKGQVMQILSEDYGVALGAVNKKQTHWQSILFHRSCVSVFRHGLKSIDLRQVFKEGDKIRFIAAAAPKGFSAQWVASNISVDVVGDAKKLVQGLL